MSGGYLITALNLGPPIVENGLTPAFFPILVGGAAIVFCSILIVQALRAQPKVAPVDEGRSYTHVWVVVAIFVYIAAFNTLGYFLSSGLFVFVLILLFSRFENLVLKAIISVTIVEVTFVMFQQLFGFRLPTLWG
ncbi:tripartite tricarboxylate transporter TctB family protein [Yoonia sp. MH D7]